MKKQLLSSIILLINITLFSCKGDQGVPGPAGANGNANVSVSSVSVSPGNWSSDGNGGWLTNFSATGYNPTTAALSIYWSTDNTNFTALPSVGYTLGAPDINYALNSTAITIYYDAQTGVSSISKPSTTIYFNIVVVPAPQVAKMKLDNVDFKNYNQVQAFIKLNSK